MPEYSCVGPLTRNPVLMTFGLFRALSRMNFEAYLQRAQTVQSHPAVMTRSGHPADSGLLVVHELCDLSPSCADQ
jgi:hypothetical protein